MAVTTRLPAERTFIRTFIPACARLVPLGAAVLLSACSTVSLKEEPLHPMPAPGTHAARPQRIDPDLPLLPPAGSGRGAYYKDDGPGDNPPANLRDIPDAVVRAEPYSRNANRPYVVFGKTYTPMLNEEPFVQRGVSTWYGKKFHGQRTSSGELYDMYKMTAAHPTLPIPSYARITSLASGKQVVVRINDRGPFHSSRIVDVSYTAALKLGLLGKGSHEVMLERLLPDAEDRIATVRRNAPQLGTQVQTQIQTQIQTPTLLQADTVAMVETAPVEMPPAFESARIDAPPPAMAPLSAPLGAALSAAPDAPPGAQVPAAQPGFYVQLGAFGRLERANEIGARIAAAGGALSVFEVVPAGAVHRLFSGPFPSRDEAMQALAQVPAALGLKPIVVRR